MFLCTLHHPFASSECEAGARGEPYFCQKFSAFTFETSFRCSIPSDPKGKVIHTWQLSRSHLPTSQTYEELKRLCGVHLFPHGSVTFTHEEIGSGIVKIDSSSKEVLTLRVEFHYTISLQQKMIFLDFSLLEKKRSIQNKPKSLPRRENWRSYRSEAGAKKQSLCLYS